MLKAKTALTKLLPAEPLSDFYPSLHSDTRYTWALSYIILAT